MRTFTLHIDFPALDALVAYLRGVEQAKIDALSAQVKELTDSLAAHNSALQGAVDQNKP